MHHRFSSCFFLLVAILLASSEFARSQTTAQPLFFTGTYDPDSQTFQSLTLVNDIVGAGVFYDAGYFGQSTTIANVEGGDIWFGHEVFDRPPDVTSTFYTYTNAAGSNELDFHATMVGNILAGSGYVSGSDGTGLTEVGIGMAPYANLWSAGIATDFSSTDTGAFDVSDASFVAPYKAFFEGINGTKPDVINSSWGGADPAGAGSEALILDGLARQNPTVALVVAAGNSGTSPDAVGSPGSDYNGITVGSLGGSSFLDPSSFSSTGPADFYNPQTNTTITGVRAVVDIAAPGENMALAAYLGPTGSLGASTDPSIQAILQNPSPTDLYFLNEAGTSFATPIVSGGVALLKDVANGGVYWTNLPQAQDTRVIKSVLMASADVTNGWSNGQFVNAQGVITTTQSLDYATGAGALDLTAAANVYVNGTHGVPGGTGGSILPVGWDLGTVALGGTNAYFFQSEFQEQMDLTVSLNWFDDRIFDDATDEGSEGSFSDLNLQVWYLGDGSDSILYAESASLYNNSEFLRLLLDEPGFYEITVTFDDVVFNMTGTAINQEDYGLAWNTTDVAAAPEPSTMLLVVFSGGLLFLWRGRKPNLPRL